MIDTTDKTLLVLAPDYPSEHGDFNGCNAIKNQLIHSSKNFKKVIVIAPVLITLGLTPQDIFCANYKHDNVEVYFPRCMFFPRAIKMPLISNYRRVNLDNRFEVTEKTIKQNNLKFDLIHAHFTYPSTYIASELKKRYHVPVLATVHEDSGWFREEREMNHPKFQQAWQDADKLVRVNTTELPLLYPFNPNTIHIPGGYDESAFMPLGKPACRELLGLKMSDRILFTFGFLDERKGFQDLITAVAHLPAQYFDVKCYISGSGAYKKTLLEKIKQLNLEDKVFILNRFEDDLITAWVNAADLFILPSLRESFGSTQIEALACGTPVIASDNVGSKDIITDGVGYIYPIGDSIALSSKIIKGLTTKWDDVHIVNYAKSKYAWEVVSKQYDEVYRSLLR